MRLSNWLAKKEIRENNVCDGANFVVPFACLLMMPDLLISVDCLFIGGGQPDRLEDANDTHFKILGEVNGGRGVNLLLSTCLSALNFLFHPHPRS